MERDINEKYSTLQNYDVVVAGGGCAGVLAAIAAARNGVKTLIIERESYLGGMLTGGLVHSLHGYRLHRNYMSVNPLRNWSTPTVLKGISLELLKNLQNAGGTNKKNRFGESSVRENFDEEIMMFVLEQMCEEAGVDVLYNAFAFDVKKEGNKVTGVYVASKSGAQIISSEVLIDCTGDGDLCASAGCEFNIGDPETGETHGAAMQMEIGGIEIDKAINYLKNRPELNEEQQKAFVNEKNRLINGGSNSPQTILAIDGTTGSFNMSGKKASWDSIESDIKDGQFVIMPANLEREWIEYLKEHPEVPNMPNTKTKLPCYPKTPSFNWIGIVRNGTLRYDQTISGLHEMFVDQTDGWALSKAIMLMRKINFYYMDFFRTKIPGFENAYIIKNSPLVGTRESRRIVGDATLTVEDCAKGVKGKDAVALSGRACNVHNMNGQHGLRYWIEPEDAYSIPYGSLVPKGVDGILVAGRCASTDFIALGATRSMPTCMSMGEAAGTAAALSVVSNVDTHNVNISELQKMLLKQGVLLPENYMEE